MLDVRYVEKQIDSMYDVVHENVKDLAPEANKDFWGWHDDSIGVSVQIRSLKQDFLQARVCNLWTEEVRYVDGDQQQLLSKLKPIMRDMAGLQ